jgi:hypothetical protein
MVKWICSKQRYTMVEPPGGGFALEKRNVLELVKGVPATLSCEVPCVADCCDVLPLVIRVSVWFGAPKRPEVCCEVPAEQGHSSDD